MSDERPIRVLCVDDDPAMLELTATHLEREGFVVTNARSAEEGLRRLACEEIDPFDCVVSDYDMPGTDGLDFLRSVREAFSELPFVLFTGRGSEEIASAAISAGVTDYLRKGAGTGRYATLVKRVRTSAGRYRTKRALERSEERYRQLIETSPTPVVICDADGQVVYGNDAAAAFVGTENAEVLVGRRVITFVHPDDEATVGARLERVLRNGERFASVERRFVSFEGETRHATVATAPVTFDDEPAAQIVFNDVTELKRTERALRQERELTRSALDAIDDIFYVIDGSGDLIRWNRQFNELSGYTDAEIESMTALDFFDDATASRVATAIAEAIETGSARANADMLTKGGERIPGELRGVRLVDDGEVIGVCGIARDVRERRQRERELERYETIIETVGDVVYTADAEGHFTAVNGALVDLLGHAREELLGEHVSVVMNDADVRTGETVIRDLLSDPDRDSGRFELELTAADGTVITCEDQISVLPAPDGDFRGTVGVLRDVSARKRRERELERYETVVETAPVGVFVLDAEGRLVDGNAAAWVATNYGEEPVGESMSAILDSALIASDAVEQYTDIVRDLLSSGNDRTRGSFETTITLDEREERTISAHVSLLPFDEEFEGTVLVAEDVTERTRHEQRLNALHEATRDLMTAASATEVAESATRAARDVLDLSLNGVLLFDESENVLVPVASTRTAQEVISELPTLGAGTSLIWQVFESGRGVVYDDLRSAPDVYNPDTPIRSEQILPLGEHGVFVAGATTAGAFTETDVSLAKVLAANAEAALDRVRRERLLYDRTEELERQNRQLDEFVSVVSHDLRNPLNVVQGHAALMDESGENGHDESEIGAHVGAISRAATRMGDLIEELLVLAKQGRVVSDPEPLELGRVATEAWEEIAGTSATLTIEDGLGRVDADRTRLRELLANLFRNSVEHGSAGERPETDDAAAHGGDPLATTETTDITDVTDITDITEVTVGPLSGGFFVADDGVGISPDERERVFDHGHTSAPDGTGFGLAIVSTIAEAHGWTVAVTESETGGARFEIEY